MSLLQITDDIAILRPVFIGLALLLFMLALLLPEVRVNGGWRRLMSRRVLAWLEDVASVSSARRARLDRTLLVAALIALALSAPAIRISDNAAWRQSVGWIALVDVSRSMTLDDTVPSRLAAARTTLLALSSAAGARPLALAIYAGDAFLVVPPAFERSLIDEHAALLEYGVVPLDGSNLARALSLAAVIAADSGFVQGRVFILGDSGGVGADSVAAARYLAEQGHRVDMVLFGNSTGSTETLAGVSGDQRVDLATSRQLVAAGSGALVQSDAFGTVRLDALDLTADARPETIDGLESLLWHDQSHWLLLIAMPLLLFSLSRRGSRDR